MAGDGTDGAATVPPAAAGEGVAWRRLLDDTRRRLAAAGIDNAAQEARWLVQRAAGFDTGELALGLDEPATLRGATFLHTMVARRVAGEPLQYVMQRWAFRTLDLYVDDRVLIPRPETEALAGLALDECRRLSARRAVDLGTGSGALALSLAVERPGLEVWATDASPGALAVASANLAGLGRRGAGVRLAEGSWFAALPARLAGTVDVIVSNPPYVAEDEMADLPAEVVDWEPRQALCSGPSGLEDIEVIVADAPRWLSRPGSLLVEMAPHQARRAVELARRVGFGSATVWPDLAGRDRILLART
ncbi:MAG TPA: peptide chain release factor N(5)-glutamine methyltransferase [Acidimicrobiales bacterium]|nr:peptide chain release factor N(5)-glutamine methyltransferase [Acidimicrobiales bacterium]